MPIAFAGTHDVIGADGAIFRVEQQPLHDPLSPVRNVDMGHDAAHRREQSRIVRVALDLEMDELEPDASAQRPVI